MNYVAAGSRNNGITFKEQWARARLLGVRFAMVGTWNEWVKGEQLSADVSKDIEPNNVWGDQYLLLLKSEIKKFKGVH
jgi:lambda repressor-like predicted transcriptional regulator